MDTVNPNWSTCIAVDYLFEVVQEITVKVFHCEGKSKPLTDENKHTLVGEATFVMSDLMRAGSGLSLKLTGGKNSYVNLNIVLLSLTFATQWKDRR